MISNENNVNALRKLFTPARSANKKCFPAKHWNECTKLFQSPAFSIHSGSEFTVASAVPNVLWFNVCAAAATEIYTEKVGWEVAYSEWVNESVLLSKKKKRERKKILCTQKMHIAIRWVLSSVLNAVPPTHKGNRWLCRTHITCHLTTSFLWFSFSPQNTEIVVIFRWRIFFTFSFFFLSPLQWLSQHTLVQLLYRPINRSINTMPSRQTRPIF